jgi:hypothetical protein
MHELLCLTQRTALNMELPVHELYCWTEPPASCLELFAGELLRYIAIACTRISGSVCARTALLHTLIYGQITLV